MKRRAVAIIQARMGSTRLPGKVLMPLGERCVLGWVVDRLKRAARLDEIVVATSIAEGDNAVADFCQGHSTACFRGSENDVLQRFVDAAAAFDASTVIRINADNPLIDPFYVDALVEAIVGTDDDYISYRLSDGRPVMLSAVSFFAEAVSRNCLDRAGSQITDAFEREHVTLGIYKRPEIYLVRFLNVPAFCDDGNLRLTLDRADDYSLLQEVIAELGPQALTAGACEVIGALDRHPQFRLRMKELNQANPKSKSC